MCGLKIIESGQGPRFVDFLQFLKQRATLVNNEFGEDLNCSLHQRTRRKVKAEMVGIDLLTSIQQWRQVPAIIEALNTKARKERIVRSKVVLSVPTSMVFGGVVNLKVYPIRTR